MDTMARIALLMIMAVAALYLACRSKKYHSTCNLIFLLVALFVTVFFETPGAQILAALVVFLTLYAIEKLLVYCTNQNSRTKKQQKKAAS